MPPVRMRLQKCPNCDKQTGSLKVLEWLPIKRVDQIAVDCPMIGLNQEIEEADFSTLKEAHKVLSERPGLGVGEILGPSFTVFSKACEKEKRQPMEVYFIRD